MRTKLILGIMFLYVWLLFTPPSEASIAQRTLMARGDIATTARAALVSGNIPSAADVRKAATLMNAIATDPKLQTIVKQAAGKSGSTTTATTLTEAADLLVQMTPKAIPIAKKAARAVSTLTVQRSSTWKAMISSESNKDLKELLQQIDLAQRKGDVRLCRTLHTSGTPDTAATHPTIGDLLALCLAKVTAEPKRCEQIDVRSASALKTLCTSELVGHV